MRRLLALLLVALLPVTPSWAGVAVDCGSGTRIEATSVTSAPADLADEAIVLSADHACCNDEAPARRCGADCVDCHGIGITAIVQACVIVPEVPAATGDTPYVPRDASRPPDDTFRPPATRLA